MAETDKKMIQDILNIEIPLELKLSPDCKSVVYMTRPKWYHKTGHRRSSPLWIADTGRPDSARPLTDGLFADRFPQWSPRGQTVGFLSDRANTSGKSVALYLLDLDADKPRAITPIENERAIPKFSFSPGGKSIAYITTAEKSVEAKTRNELTGGVSVWGEDWDYAQLKLVDIETGDIEIISNKEAHVADFAWCDDSTKIAVVTHQTPHGESHHVHGTTISIVHLATRETTVIARVPGDISCLTWAKSMIYFLAYNILGQVTSGLAVYSIKIASDTQHEGYVYKKETMLHNEDCCAISLSGVNGDIIVKTERGIEDELWLLGENKLLLSQKKTIRHFDGKRSPNGGFVVAFAQGDVNNPTEMFSLISGEALQLSNHGSIFKDKSFGHCTFIDCQTADGKETLGGVYLTPTKDTYDNGEPTKPLPTFILLHGGPYGRSSNQFDAWNPFTFICPLLLTKGFSILMPNYRGSSGRGQQFASYSKGGLGIYDEPDIVTMTQYVVARRWADKDRLVVGGWSQGGYLSYLSSVRNGVHDLGWKFRGAICGAGVTDWDSMVLTSDIGYEEAQYVGIAPWTALDKHNSSSRSGSAIWEFKAAADAGRIPPMLILHGEHDQRVPVSQAHAFRRALDQAGLMDQTEFVTYPREGHHFTERKHVEDLMERMFRFIKTHLS